MNANRNAGEAMKSETRLGPDPVAFGEYPILSVAKQGSYRFS